MRTSVGNTGPRAPKPHPQDVASSPVTKRDKGVKRYLRPAQSWIHRSVPVPFALGHAVQQGARGWIVARRDRSWSNVRRGDFAKASQTLFVLGSGESINELTANYLATIAEHGKLYLAAILMVISLLANVTAQFIVVRFERARRAV